jgi:stage III sporulation protein AG
VDLKPLLQNKWLLVLAVIGIVCLLVGSFWKPAETTRPTSAQPASAVSSGAPGQGAVQSASTSDSSDPTILYEAVYDKKLEDMLRQIQGVNDVSVMVKLDTSASLKVATNTKETRQNQGGNGASTSTTTTVDESVFTQRLADGSSTPFVVQSTAPTVRGVLVVVDAEDFFVAKSEIIDAIKNVLDVPAYKISVEPKKS